MVEKSLLLILGNQLFSIEDIKSLNPEKVFMAEDLGLSTCLLYTSPSPRD